MATLKGKYTFKEVLDVESLIAAGELTEYFNFISGYEGNPVQHYVLEHSGMYIEYDYFGTGIYFGYLTPPDNTKNLVYYTKWENERLRYVDFGNGVNMSDRLSSWVLANADPVADPQYSIKTSTLTAIANSIRAKTGGSSPILTENMASEIEGIDTAEPWDESFTVKEGAVMTGIVKPLTITKNGTYTAPEGVDGYSPVIVNTYGGGEVNPMNYYIKGKTSLASLFSNYTTLTGEEAHAMLSGVDTSHITSTSNMFSSCSALTSVPWFDTSNVTSMQSMFNSCYALTSVPLFNTSNVTDMYMMFCCWSTDTALTSVPNFETSNVTNTSNMFRGRSALASDFVLDLSSATNTNGMFYGCASIKKIDISNLASINADMFNRCQTLEVLVLRTTDTITALSNISAFDMTPFGRYAPSGYEKGVVYVSQAFIETYQNATNWSTLYTEGKLTFVPIEGSEYE